METKKKVLTACKKCEFGSKKLRGACAGKRSYVSVCVCACLHVCVCACMCMCVWVMKWAYPYVFVSDPGSQRWCTISNILSSFHSLRCAHCAARRAVCGKRCTAWTCQWSNSCRWWKDCCTSHTRCTAAASRLCGDSIETLLRTALATDLSCPYGGTAPFMGRLCLCWCEQLLCCCAVLFVCLQFNTSCYFSLCHLLSFAESAWKVSIWVTLFLNLQSVNMSLKHTVNHRESDNPVKSVISSTGFSDIWFVVSTAG